MTEEKTIFVEEGKSREEALALSKKPWGKKNNGGDAA